MRSASSSESNDDEEDIDDGMLGFLDKADRSFPMDRANDLTLFPKPVSLAIATKSLFVGTCRILPLFANPVLPKMKSKTLRYLPANTSRRFPL